jgi:hypothetical protein
MSFNRRYPVRWLHLAAIGIGVPVLLTTIHEDLHPFAIMALAVMALVAELLPVPISRFGVRVTLTLPFLTGMASAAGAGAALLTDLFVTFGAACILACRARQPIHRTWLSINLSIGTVSCAIAGIAGELVRYGLADARSGFAASAVIFTFVYLAVNVLLVAYFGGLASGRRKGMSLVRSLQIEFSFFAFYALVSIAISLLVLERHYWALPLMMIPVLALRAGLSLRTKMHDQHYETILALSLMLQRAHPYTHGHIERVAKVAEGVGLRLGLSAHRARLLRQAAILHDIGKIAIDEAILQKPGKLNADEMRHVRMHAEYGARILRQSPAFEPIVPWVACHHERPDGRGYPQSLMDYEIPLESKIIAVVDAYDAMVGGDEPGDKRLYREPMTAEEALAELERCTPMQFDPNVVKAFKDVLGVAA